MKDITHDAPATREGGARDGARERRAGRPRAQALVGPIARARWELAGRARSIAGGRDGEERLSGVMWLMDHGRGVGAGAREEAKTRGDGMTEKPQREAGRASGATKNERRLSVRETDVSNDVFA